MRDNTIKIEIKIADRSYPLIIKKEEEKKIVEMVGEIEKLIQYFEEKYTIRDMQDALAMALLQYVTRTKEKSLDVEIKNRIDKLNEKIDKYLTY